MYSDQLITRAKKYFENRFGESISGDEIAEYLNLLADVFIGFSSLDDRKSSTPKGEKIFSSDLISPHSC